MQFQFISFHFIWWLKLISLEVNRKHQQDDQQPVESIRTDFQFDLFYIREHNEDVKHM